MVIFRQKIKGFNLFVRFKILFFLILFSRIFIVNTSRQKLYNSKGDDYQYFVIYLTSS